VHPTETTLLAFVHRELRSPALAEVAAHIESCPACEQQICELLRADEEIAQLLGRLDHPVPTLAEPVLLPRARRSWVARALLAAGIAAVTTVVAAAAVPGWPLHDWIRARLPISSVAPVRMPQTPVPAAEAGAAGIAIPAPSTLIVAFREPQTSGALTVTRSNHGEVSLRSWGGDVAYQVGDQRVAVDNRRPATRYTLEVPATVQQLTVLIGGRVAARKGPAELGALGDSTQPTAIPLQIP
jgi:anti-sigma factor RsiW